MTSKRLRDAPSHKSCPTSSIKIREDIVNMVNPEFDQLSSKKQSLPYNKAQFHLCTPQVFHQLFLSTLSHHFQLKFPTFYSLCKKWLLGQWKEVRMNLQSRLTKIKYLQPTLSYESYSVIEKEVRIEWRKNPLLKGFTYIWTHMFQTYTFKTLQEIRQYYNAFCNAFATLTLCLFRTCLQGLVAKGVQLRLKLQRQTAPALVTELKQWRQIFTTQIYGFLEQNTISFSENFQLESIQINPRILDVHSSKQLFSKTKKSLEGLIDSLTTQQIVNKLTEFRSNLLKDMEESIQNENSDNKHLTVEKEDVLGCIIFTLVRYKLDSIGVVLEYLAFLLGKDIDTVLRWWSVDCFRTDLEASYWFVSHPVVEIEFPKDVLGKIVTN